MTPAQEALGALKRKIEKHRAIEGYGLAFGTYMPQASVIASLEHAINVIKREEAKCVAGECGQPRYGGKKSKDEHRFCGAVNKARHCSFWCASLRIITQYDNDERLSVYRCASCNGWHLTSHADPVERVKQYDERGAYVREYGNFSFTERRKEYNKRRLAANANHHP